MVGEVRKDIVMLGAWVMNLQFGLAAVFVMAVCGSGVDGVAQEVADSEAIVELNQGIYEYLQGTSRGGSTYPAAIEHLSAVLAAAPDDRTALLFRALAHGRMGLEVLSARLETENRTSNVELVLGMRDDPEARQRLEAELRDCEAKLGQSSLPPTEILTLGAKKERLSDLKSMIDENLEQTREQIEGGLRSDRVAIHEASIREREHYSLMVADLERLNAAIEKAGDLVRPLNVGLLDVVAKSKIARIDAEDAARIEDGEIAEQPHGGTVEALRERANAMLAETTRLLQEMLDRDLQGEDAVRTKFFLGVIRFRQAIPRVGKHEMTKIDHARLDDARRIMEELAEDGEVELRWRSYASLYLGLMLPVQAQGKTESGARSDLLDRAEHFLGLAVAFDADTSEGKSPTSMSHGIIPGVVVRQREEVIKALREAKTSAGAQNDILFSLFVGAHRDTNVVLLGERTDLPRDISRTKDFGFTLGAAVDYTYNLGNIDPSYRRWTFGLRGKTTQLFNIDVDEFDEQTYGTTMAVQYEVMEKRGDFGPIFFRLQYDFSYTNLGRAAFLGSNTLRPDVRIYWWNRRAETSVYFSYERRKYHEPLFDVRFDRTGDYFSFGVTQSARLIEMTPLFDKLGLPAWGSDDDELKQDDPDYPKRYFTPYVGVEYSWDSTNGDEFDQNEYQLLLGFAVPLPWGWQFDASGSFQWQDYRQQSLTDFHRRPRRDFVQEYNVGLQRTFVLEAGDLVNRYTPRIDRTLMTVRAHGRWTNDDSNVVDRSGQAVFSYDRVFYGVTVAFAFN